MGPNEEELVQGTEDVTETAASPGTKKAPKKKGSLFNDIMEILETMMVSVFVILLLFTYFIRPVTVDGHSMVPTLNNGDRLVMYRLFYKPHTGDVIIINNHEAHVLENGTVIPLETHLVECLIKRVIAVSGQELRIDASKGEVWVDGELLDEPYINEPVLTDDRAFSYPITIPEGYVFVMGDNRNHSTDSRSPYVGLVSEKDVMGKAFFEYYAAEDKGYEKTEIGFVG